MQIETLILIIIGLSALIYPLYRFVKNSKSQINKYLLLISFNGFIWTISIALFRNTNNMLLARFYLHGIYISGIFMALYVNLLFKKFYNTRTTHSYKLFLYWDNIDSIITSLLTGLLLILYFTRGFIQDINLTNKPNTVKLGQQYLYWALIFIIYISYPFIKVIWQYRSFSRLKKIKTLYLITSFIIAGLISAFFDIILPGLGNYKDIWIGPITIIILNVFWAYSLSRTHYLSKLTIKKFLIESFTYITYFLLTISVFIYLYNLAQPHTTKTIIILTLILVLLSSIALPTLISLIQKFVIPKVIKDANRFQNAKLKFEHNIYKHLNFSDLTNFIATYLQKNFNTKWVYITHYKVTKTGNIQLLFTYNNGKIKTLTKNKIKRLLYQLSYLEEHLVLRDELELSIPEYLDEQLNKELKNKVALWQFIEKNNIPGLIRLPLRNNRGILIIMEERNPYVFSSEEIELLKYIERTLRLAYSRSILYQQILEFNDNLQKEIEKATKNLKLRLEQIQVLRRKERDMLDIMGHELRTPLSIIKMTLELLNMKLASHTFTIDDYKKYSERMTEALQREIILLERMLSSAKLDANKMKVNKEKVDLKKIINNTLLAFSKQAQEKGLELKSNINKFKDLYISGDKVRTPEVIDNLVSNAIKYTEKGSVTIEVKEEKDFIKVAIIDTGIGIPKDKIKLLGQKFYRVNQYINDDAHNIVRPGGTGLGLYVTFNLIKLMGGKYKVNSEVGKGSSFIVYFKKWNNT